MKKRMFIIATWPLWVMGLLSSCEYTTHVQGQVVNRITGEPIQGAHVIMQDELGLADPYGDNPSVNDKAETYSDASGNFKIELKTNRKDPLFFCCGFEYFDLSLVNGGPMPLNIKGNNNFLIELQGRANIEMTFKNTIGTVDSVYIDKLPYTHPKAINSSSYYFNVWNTGGVDNLIVGDGPYRANIHTIGDVYTQYRIRYRRDGKWFEKKDSVFLKTGTNISADKPITVSF